MSNVWILSPGDDVGKQPAVHITGIGDAYILADAMTERMIEDGERSERITDSEYLDTGDEYQWKAGDGAFVELLQSGSEGYRDIEHGIANAIAQNLPYGYWIEWSTGRVEYEAEPAGDDLCSDPVCQECHPGSLEINLCDSCAHMIGSAENPTPEDLAAADAMAENWPDHVLTTSDDEGGTMRYCDGCGINDGIQKHMQTGYAIPRAHFGTGR